MFKRWLIFSAVVAQAWAASTVSGQTDRSRPNIVVILCDDLGYGDLECYGHPHIKTPHINQLAASGIRFTSFYSAAPVCSPSRVGLLTGRSPNRAGVYDWIPAAGENAQPDGRELVHLRATETTLPGLLRQAGYATCMSGKWHCNSRFNSADQPQPSHAGFDHWFGTQNNASPSHKDPANYVRNGSSAGKLEGFSCQLAAAEAITWLQQHLQEHPRVPFFVYLAFHEPHEPVASPSDLVDAYRPVAGSEDEAQYFANVANLDLAVGRVLAALEELGIREQTMVVFSSDNGPETLNRYRTANRSYGRASPLRGMKLWTTDGGFRVAGIMSWPKQISAGQVSHEVVSSLDLLPTFCSLAGAPLPQDLKLDGVDVRAVFTGEEIERPQPLLWCYYNALNEQRVAMRHGPWKMLARLDSGGLPTLTNVHPDNQAAVRAAELTDFELFQISQDIVEQQDLFAEAPEAPQLEQLMRDRYRELVQDSHVWTTRIGPEK